MTEPELIDLTGRRDARLLAELMMRAIMERGMRPPWPREEIEDFAADLTARGVLVRSGLPPEGEPRATLRKDRC